MTGDASATIVPRQVCIVGFYMHISRTGRTKTGLLKRELQDNETGEVLKTGKYCAYLRLYAKKQGWQLVTKEV